ncbi:hypothetical protein ACHQM5_018157 [Ranunculus cassubicifolius]
MLGDFNAILRAYEKMGGRGIMMNSINEFNRLVSDFGMVDLGNSGPKFTWSNIRRIGSNVIERLDRVLATNDWI